LSLTPDEVGPTGAGAESRQLTNGQRAFAALRYEERYAEAAKQAQREGGGTAWASRRENDADQDELVNHNRGEGDAHDRQTASRAAKATGTSRGSFDKAKAIERDAPDPPGVSAGRESRSAGAAERTERENAGRQLTAIWR
jgi:hypothetical protein